MVIRVIKTAENFESSLWFVNLLIMVATAVNFEILIQLLKSKQARVDTAIKDTVVNSEMTYRRSY